MGGQQDGDDRRRRVEPRRRHDADHVLRTDGEREGGDDDGERERLEHALVRPAAVGLAGHLELAGLPRVAEGQDHGQQQDLRALDGQRVDARRPQRAVVSQEDAVTAVDEQPGERHQRERRAVRDHPPCQRR